MADDETPEEEFVELTYDEDSDDYVPLSGNSASPKKGPNPQLDTELGISNVLPVGAWLSWLSDGTSDGATIVNTDPLSIDKLTEMLKKDGQARSLYRLMALPILATLKNSKWVSPEDQDGGQDEADFANLMFSLPPSQGGMSTPLSKIMRQTLRGLALGFSPFEEVRYVPEDGPLKGKIVLQKLAYREPRTIRFRVDQDGGYNGLRQLTQVMGRPVDVNIPPEKTWYWAAQEEENPFYGISYFEAAWHHYDIKKKLYYIAHLAAQFAAVPGRVGETPANPDPRQLKAFKDALQSFAFNTAMVAPVGYKVEPFNGNSNFDFLKLIDHHNMMMAQSVLAKFMQQDDRASLINIQNANSDPSADMFCMMLEAIMHSIAESWTYYLMPKYIDWNFGSGLYPEFKFGELTDSTRQAVQEIFTTAMAAPSQEQGGNMTPEFYRQLEQKIAKELDLDVDYDEVEQREEQQAQEQEQQDNLNAQQAQSALQIPQPPQPAQQPFNPNQNGPSPTDGGQQPQGGGGAIPGQGALGTNGGMGMGGQSVPAVLSGGGGYISLSEIAAEIEALRDENSDEE